MTANPNVTADRINNVVNAAFNEFWETVQNQFDEVQAEEVAFPEHAQDDLKAAMRRAIEMWLNESYPDNTGAQASRS